MDEKELLRYRLAQMQADIDKHNRARKMSPIYLLLAIIAIPVVPALLIYIGHKLNGN